MVFSRLLLGQYQVAANDLKSIYHQKHGALRLISTTHAHLPQIHQERTASLRSTLLYLNRSPRLWYAAWHALNKPQTCSTAHSRPPLEEKMISWLSDGGPSTKALRQLLKWGTWEEQFSFFFSFKCYFIMFLSTPLEFHREHEPIFSAGVPVIRDWKSRVAFRMFCEKRYLTASICISHPPPPSEIFKTRFSYSSAAVLLRGEMRWAEVFHPPRQFISPRVFRQAQSHFNLDLLWKPRQEGTTWEVLEWCWLLHECWK